MAGACQTPGGDDEKRPAVEVSDSGQHRVVSLRTRPGVRQQFTILAPAKPVAAAIYFRGTNGLGSVQDTGDVLPRSGVAFVLVDPPSNRPQGFSSGERSRKDHAADIDAVIRYLRQGLRVPVWLVGMSMGTVSVANAALHGAAGPDGVVFMAPVTAQYFGKAPFGEWLVTDFPLAELKVPVLAVIHEKDTCAVTPSSGAAEVVRRAARAPAREAKAFDGGYELSRDPCVGNSYHTFAGIRAQVAEYVADFIVKHSKQPR